MSRRWAPLQILSITALLSAQPSHADEPATVLTQTSGFFGAMTALVGKRGTLVESKRLGLTIFTQAPGWAVSTVRSTDRTYFQAPIPRWKETFSFANSDLRKNKNYTVRKGRTGTIAGLPAVEYVMASPEEWAKAGSKPPSRRCEFWVASTLSAPKEAIDVLSNASGLPKSIGVPLRIIRYRKGKSFCTLDTVASKPGTLKSSTMLIPKGYTAVKDELDFMMGLGGSSDLGGLLDATK